MTDIISKIMDAKPVLTESDMQDIKKIASLLPSADDGVTLEMSPEFAMAVSIVLLAGIEALEE